MDTHPAPLLPQPALASWPGGRSLVLAASLAGVFAVGALDYTTGHEVGVSLLYLLPIGWATWVWGRWPGFATAITAAVVWYLADIGLGQSHSHWAIPLWNAGIRLGFFVVTIILLSRLHRVLREHRRLIGELRASAARVRTLQGLIPICAWCKKIRDDRGFWNAVEAYIAAHSEAEFTHSVCPECLDQMRRESQARDGEA